MAETADTSKKEKVEPELHLFVLWPRAQKRQQIIDLITAKFEVLYNSNFEIYKENMPAFLSQFYGIKLPSVKAKLGHTGTGLITLIIVEDSNPQYGKRMYHNRSTEVNTGTFDLRLSCRNLSGDPDTIHGTINALELYHDLPLLIGEDKSEELLLYYGR
jgi:cytochrome c biogenesis factor